MVDVSEKALTAREAIAKGTVKMKPETLKKIKSGGIKKGDVLAVAQVAGIMAAKSLGYYAVGILRIGDEDTLRQAGSDIVIRDLQTVKIEALLQLDVY